MKVWKLGGDKEKNVYKITMSVAHGCTYYNREYHVLATQVPIEVALKLMAVGNPVVQIDGMHDEVNFWLEEQ